MLRSTDSERIIKDPVLASQVYKGVRTLGIDLETTGLDYPRARIAVVSIAAPDLPPAVIQISPPDQIPVCLRDVLAQAHWVGHNITNFDIPFLWRLGISPVQGWSDTMILEQLVLTGRRGVSFALDRTLTRRVGVEIDKALGRNSVWGGLYLTADQLAYAANDVRWLVPLWENQLDLIRQYNLTDSWELERKCQIATAYMRYNGVPINLAKLQSFIRSVAGERARLHTALLAKYQLQNPASPQQVSAVARSLGLILPTTRHETLLSCMAELPHDHPAREFLAQVTTYRSLTRQMMYDSDWCGKYVINNRVYPSYLQLGADTGRFTAREPNIHQWIASMRGIVEAGPGNVLVYADYKQLEVVVACAWYKDSTMLDLVKQGIDIHRHVASMALDVPYDQVSDEERSNAKLVVWTYLFAGGEQGMKAGLTEEAQQRVSVIKRKLVELFPTVAAVQRQTDRHVEWYKRRGLPMIVRPKLGPRREISPLDLRTSRVINTLVQGTAATGLKRALARLVDEGVADRLVTAVHDEIVMECPESEAQELAAILKRVMEEEMMDHLGLPVGVDLKIAKAWS